MALNLHPLAGGSTSNLIELLSTHQVESKYLPKLLAAAAVSLVSFPSRQVSRLQFDHKVDALDLEQDPVFILGHWRSGTTYLHHLMSQDDSFSYVSSYQAWVPELFLKDSFLTRFVVKKSLPKKRPIDNVELSLKKPEEEEFVMANMTPHSFIHTFFFPKDMLEIFRKSVLFQSISEADKAQWERTYVKALKMASLSMDGKRPLVKSPANTARIETLLKLFPNAKFIHIYRNPYTVFVSQRYTCMKLIEMWSFQDVSLQDVEDNILLMYRELMQRYFESKDLIPPENLIEIRYEDLEANQLKALEAIYDKLALPGFEQVRHRFEAYITDHADYKKNAYDIKQSVMDKVYQHWKFTIDRWGYSQASTLAA